MLSVTENQNISQCEIVIRKKNIVCSVYDIIKTVNFEFQLLFEKKNHNNG